MKSRNRLETNKCIDYDRLNTKNWRPCHELQQICGGRKYLYTAWIRTTDNLLTHPRICFSINEHCSNKYDKEKSKSTKEVLNKELEGDFISSKAIN